MPHNYRYNLQKAIRYKDFKKGVCIWRAESYEGSSGNCASGFKVKRRKLGKKES